MLCRVASADWVLTTPSNFVREFELHRCITWRRVIADEAHQLKATQFPPEYLAQYGGRDIALTHMLADVPAACGHWLLTGTPLNNFKQVC